MPGSDVALQTEETEQQLEGEQELRRHKKPWISKYSESDEFDNGWTKSARSALAVQGENKNGKVIEHTFFGQDETGLNMLVSEQK